MARPLVFLNSSSLFSLLAVAVVLLFAACSSSIVMATALPIPQIENSGETQHATSPGTSPDALGLSIIRDYQASVGSDELSPAFSSWTVDTTPSYRLGFPLVTPEELRKMSNKDLRRFIAERGGRCDGCVEKVHLLERALALRRIPTQNEEIVSMLTPFSTSAPLALSTDLLRPQTEEEIIQSHQFAMSNAVLRDHTYYCELVERQDEAGSAEGKQQQQDAPRVPEISCRPRTAEDGPYE